MTTRRFHRCPVCNSPTTTSAWCDVAGGLPDDYKTVIVALADGVVTHAWRRKDGNWYHDLESKIDHAEILYWLPLPPHPDAPQEQPVDDRDHWEEQTLMERDKC